MDKSKLEFCRSVNKPTTNSNTDFVQKAIGTKRHRKTNLHIRRQ